MQLPVFKNRSSGRSQEMISEFRGYDRRERIAEGAWHDEEGFSAEHYPVLSTRRPRKTVRDLTAPAGLASKDGLITIEGPNVIYNGMAIDLELTASGPKQLISMGAYLLVWPDKKYLNTKDPEDHGSLEKYFSNVGGDVSGVQISLCDGDGNAYDKTPTTAAVAPTEPSDGDYWIDTSNADVPVLKQWNEGLGYWVQIPTTYVRIKAPYDQNSPNATYGTSISDGFSAGDGVTIADLGSPASQTDAGRQLYALNGSRVVRAVGDGYIVVEGLISGAYSWYWSAGITVSRSVPDMDFVTECDNRLWGCKYGTVDGKPINEIYASKLGDFKNWSCYQGLSTDSYTASRGSDGAFTGAITHMGHPLFFRENSIEKVYPSANGAHQIVTVEGRGVQKGCWRSLTIVGETLYYKSRSGVCAYTGSLPVLISDELGDDVYEDARAGTDGSVLYLSMRRSDGTWHLFTYDTARGIWHRQDATRAMMFAADEGRLYWIDEDRSRLVCAAGDERENFPWQLTSGVIGHDIAEQKYISRFLFRVETTGSVNLQVRYDNGPWQDKGAQLGRGLGTIVLPVAPRRCDHMQYRLSGKGAFTIYSITKYVERGSDAAW